MARTYVITGTASGMGKATKESLENEGARVIGVDIRDAEVIADLASASGREEMVQKVGAISGGAIDAIIACAGVMAPVASIVKVNFFGAVATLEGLRPLLATGDYPRAVVIGSLAMLHPCSERIIEACLAGEESEAIAIAKAEESGLVYASSKRALARRVRRQAPTPEWAGNGIPLNLIAPGIIVTPMAQPFIDDPQGRAMLDEAVPMPLGGYGKPEQVASLLRWLASPENSMMTGQAIFIDGGADVVLRGDDIW